MNWDAFDIFLRLAASPSMSAAAAGLKLSVPTIARRIAALEHEIGAPLVRRTPRGLSLTPEGAALRDRAAACRREMAEVQRFARTLATGPSPERVRVSATEPVIAEVLAPQLPALLAGMPASRLELRVQNALASLALDDADIAVRLARPEGDSLMAKRLKPLAMGLFGRRDHVAAATDGDGSLSAAARFLAYDDSYGRIAELGWIDAAGVGAQVVLRCSSTRALLEAARAGAGLAVLPAFLARRHPELEELRDRALPPIAERHVWIVWHRDLNRRKAVKRVVGWIGECFREAARPPETAARAQ
jgi:DNA-binding transcriptional LysR family regulator